MTGPADPRAWLIICSATTLDRDQHREPQLARLLAGRYRVIFCEPPADRPRLHLSVDGVAPDLWRVRTVSAGRLGRSSRWLNRIVRCRTARGLRRWFGPDRSPRLLWIDEDLSAPMIGRLDEHAVLYDAVDLDWMFTRVWNRRHLRRSLATAVGAADLVITSSSALGERLPPSRHPPVLVGNAGTTSDDHPTGRPIGRPSPSDRPVLIYAGSIDARLDADVLAAVAAARPSWTIVLVGPEGLGAGRLRHRLRRAENVRFRPAVSSARIPHLLRQADLAVLPYRLGTGRDYVHPVKLYDAWSAGLPVISSVLPALLDLDADRAALRLASEPRQWVSAAEELLAMNAEARARGRRAGRRLVAQNQWRHRADQLDDHLSELLAGAGRSAGVRS